jgi:hypothetical protein
MTERQDNSKERYIEDHQEEIADILIKSFYYSKSHYQLQIKYWRQEKENTGIDILAFTPSQLMGNSYIRDALTSAFYKKHNGNKLTRPTAKDTLESELGKAMFTALHPQLYGK